LALRLIFLFLVIVFGGIDQKHFADRYGTEYVEHWGKSKNHSAVHQREMKESD